MQNTALNQLFASEVEKRIFESNEFLTRLKNVSQYLNYRTVNIPNYTTSSASVKINSSSFNYNTFSQTTETFVSFNTDNFRLDPIHVEDFEELVTSYDKFALVTAEKIAELTNQVALRVLWVLASNVPIPSKSILTTGATGTANDAAGISGRKKITFADIAKLKSVMDGDALVQNGRWILFDNVMYMELLQDANIIQYLQFGVSVAPEGNIDRLLGFSIMMKPTIAICGSSGTAIKTYAATAVTGDRRIAIAFQQDIPVMAMSDVKVYTQSGIPQLYGSVISAEIDLAVHNPRYDNKGVYLIIQG